MVKKIFLIVAVILSCGAVLVGGAWCSVQCIDSPCSMAQIVISDSLQRQFVRADELELFLKKNGCYPQGKMLSEVDCHVIEQTLLKHEIVRTAACYKSPFNTVHISITQRVPLLSVVSLDGCYYVDTDRQIMPVRNQIDVDVPIFRGTVSQRVATEAYFDFVQWLNGNRYWRTRIDDIYVQNPNYIVLRQKDGDAKIILGTLDDYVDKLDKLRKLFTKGLDHIGYPECREYDLRFDGQVISRK